MFYLLYQLYKARFRLTFKFKPGVKFAIISPNIRNEIRESRRKRRIVRVLYIQNKNIKSLIILASYYYENYARILLMTERQDHAV